MFNNLGNLADLMKQAGDSRLMNLAMKISREMHLIEAQFRALKEKEARKAERAKVPADERRAQRIIRHAEDLNLSQQVRRSGSTGGLVVSRPAPGPDSHPDSRPQAEAEDEAWEDEDKDWEEENEAGHGDEEQRDPRLDPEALLRWVERVLDGDTKASPTLRASDAPQRAAGQGVAPREVGAPGPGGG